MSKNTTPRTFLNCCFIQPTYPNLFSNFLRCFGKASEHNKKGKIIPDGMLSFNILLSFCVLATVKTQQEVDERPFLRILAPKFICNDKKVNQTAPSSNVTIGLQTREGQRLRYKITVDFEMLGGQFKSQQHTISIWKNIRLLQKKFNDISDDISLKNQIEINAKEVCEGRGCWQKSVYNLSFFSWHRRLFTRSKSPDLTIRIARVKFKTLQSRSRAAS